MKENRKRKWELKCLWEPRDLFLGAYWNRKIHQKPYDYMGETVVRYFYICLIPCFPLRVVTYIP